MSRVITFSRVFPSYHPKAGQPTRFIEKIYASLADTQPGFKIPNDANAFWDWHEYYNAIPKHHTIRAGHRWKAGDWFKPVVWGDNINPKSGRKGPYHSNQITFAPDIQIKKVLSFSIGLAAIYINQQRCIDKSFIAQVAANDGLCLQEFLDWFQYPKPFSGQIICWNENIEY